MDSGKKKAPRTRRHHAGRSQFLCALVLVASTAACPNHVSKPTDTLRAYVLALKQGDHQRAYSLLSDELKRRCSMGQFVANVKQMGKKALKKVEPLLVNPKKLTFRAELGLGEHDSFVLIKEKGAWRIASDPLNFYGQSTPRQALVSFVRALGRKRYRILLRFVPNKYRHTMTVSDVKKLYTGDNQSKTDTLLRNLKANLKNKIEKKNGQAIMLYGENHQLRMIREDGVWKIHDFE